MKFEIQKNGYNTKQVDEYINLLENQKKEEILAKTKEIEKLEQDLDNYQKKSHSITLALTAAVDKAKEIEESSRNIYKLKIEQLTLLYSKWEILLNDIIKKYPNSTISGTKTQMIELRNAIDLALKDDFNVDIMKASPATDPIKSLLVKLTSRKAIQEGEMSKKILFEKRNKASDSKTELSKLEEKAKNIKPIANLNLNKNEKYENLVDKFLDEDTQESPMLAKLVLNKETPSPNESGFDLNECVNPTEDLEEIMKSFDFYNKKAN